MKINNEKSQIWTLSGPPLPQILGGCSATSLLKIWNVISDVKKKQFFFQIVFFFCKKKQVFFLKKKNFILFSFF